MITGTGDCPNPLNEDCPGTSARVYITLYGERGNSAEHNLDNDGRNNFENGQYVSFWIVACRWPLVAISAKNCTVS